MTTHTSYPQGAPCYVELNTPDQPAAKEFYQALFGWELQDEPMGGEAFYTSVRRGDAHLAGITSHMEGMAGHPAFWSVYLTVDDVDAAAEKVTAAGGVVEAGPMDVMDLGRMAAIQDPTKARVNLWQPRTSIGTEVRDEPGTPAWNELFTPDVKTATEFYTAVLGLEWDTESMGDMGDYTMSKIGDLHWSGVMALPADDPTPPHWNVYFGVADTDATVATAESHGAKVVVPPMDVPHVGRMALLADPQGGMFWIIKEAADQA